jgi:hypothetical protein
MIIKCEDQVFIKFGYGDIKVTSARFDNMAVLGFNNQTPHEIGSRVGCNETIESLEKSDILITFESIASLEVVILKLQEARSMVINGVCPDTDNIVNITEIYQPNIVLKG